jgi:hypothetical protein
VASDTSVHIEVIADAKALLSDKREWKRSRLAVEKGEIDLVAVLKEFHIQMLQSYGSFVAKTFFPELQPASEFFDKLTKEAHCRDPVARMIFFSEEPELKKDETGKTSGKFNMIMVPNDVFAELGIKVANLN